MEQGEVSGDPEIGGTWGGQCGHRVVSVGTRGRWYLAGEGGGGSSHGARSASTWSAQGPTHGLCTPRSVVMCATISNVDMLEILALEIPLITGERRGSPTPKLWERQHPRV